MKFTNLFFSIGIFLCIFKINYTLAHEAKLEKILYFAKSNSIGYDACYFVDIKDNVANLEQFIIQKGMFVWKKTDNLIYNVEKNYFKGQYSKIKIKKNDYYIDGLKLTTEKFFDKKLCRKFCYFNEDFYRLDIIVKLRICRNANYYYLKWKEVSKTYSNAIFFQLVKSIDITLPENEYKKKIDILAEEYLQKKPFVNPEN
ncbi:MAG: hypothetical protein ACMUIP_15100 [bacterium]